MVKRSKVLKIGLMVIGAITLMILTIWGAIWVSNIDNRKAAAAFPKCTGKHAAHKVMIQNDKMVPAHTDAKRCDTLEIMNLDDKQRIIAFGRHEKHIAYDGVSERYMPQNAKFEVTLIQPGNFLFHDHEDEDVRGTFTVNQ
jgi:hypothetical protein